MLKKFKSFLEVQQLLVPTDNCLLAVSGGIDSIVMVHLFEQSGLKYGIAHCNFQLRGADADADEDFVKQLAQQFARPFYSTRFDTEALAKQNKWSIQMAARNARYPWLEQIRVQHQYQWIATAHHLDDQLETIVYNLAKGTGIRGLRGIPLKNGFLIRPLQFADKQMIETFALEHSISFRTDQSNASDKYVRNQIRHHIIPELRKINPSLSQSTRKTLAHLQDSEALLDWALVHIRQEVMKESSMGWQIDLEKLQQFPAVHTIIYELLRPFGFNGDQVQQILAPHAPHSGQQFVSESYQIFINRKQLILEKRQSKSVEHHFIAAKQRSVATQYGAFTFSEVEGSPTPLPKDPQCAILDMEQITFPLQLRKWKAGDYFHPLGMNGNRQKLKDFFINQKLSIPEKQKTWILESNGKICWVVGLRIDERFKISKQTQKVLKVSWTVSQ